MSSLPFQPRPDSRLSVIGVTGQGKSHFRYLFQQRIYRCTLWNPMGDFDLGETMSVDDYRENIEDMRRGSLSVTVVPTAWDEDGMAEEFDACCAYVEEVGAQHFEIEEPSLVCTPNRVPPRFNKICVRGRHRAVSMGMYGQRFHQFPIISRGQSNEIIAFRQMEPDDVGDFEERIYPHVSPIPLNQLPHHHFIHWTPERGAVYCKPLPLTEQANARIGNHGWSGRPDDGSSGASEGNSLNRPRRSAVHQLTA